MIRRACTAAAALVLLSGVTSYTTSASASTVRSGTTYTWLGTTGGGGDGHAWTDPQNWQPLGVPGNGDSVVIAATSSGVCTALVDDLPSTVRLTNLTLSAEPGCRAGMRGGAVSVAGSLAWSAGTIDSVLTLLANATGSVGGRPADGALELDKSLDVRGRLAVSGVVRVAPNLVVSVADGGRLSLAPGTSVLARGCCAHPDVLELGRGGTVAVQSDRHHVGPATISGFVARVAEGTTDVAPGSVLRIVHGPRGLLNNATFQGGGEVILADPTDSENSSTFADGSRLVLAPGGTIDGTSLLVGEGFFTWRGGHLSGLDLGFALLGFTVDGTAPKRVDEEHGFFSNIEVLSNATIESGTAEHRNVLDLSGGSLDVFSSTLTVHANVEVRSGAIGAPDEGIMRIDAGPHGAVSVDRGGAIVGGTLDVAAGTLVSRGPYLVENTTVDRRGVLRLPDPRHPLQLQGGTLTGQGMVIGNVLNASGTFEPYNGGSDVPLRITGSYTQQSGASLLLDVAPHGRPVRFGAADVHGTVTYANRAGYVPPTGTERTILSSPQGLVWAPDCEQTQADEDDHWVSAQVRSHIVATFTAGTGDVC